MTVQNLDNDHPPMLSAATGYSAPLEELRVVDPRPLLQVIWRSRYSVAWIAVIFALAALNLALALSPKYEATAQLLVDPSGLNVLRDDISERPTRADTALAEAESQIGVIRSNDVMFEVIRRANLEADIEFGNPEPGLIGSVIGLFGSSDNAVSPTLRALRALSKTTEVARTDNSFVVDISVWTKDPEKSALIANTFAEAYLERTRGARTKVARRSSEALEARLEDLRQRVIASEQRVERYRTENDIVDAGGLLVVEQQLTEGTRELSRMRARVAELQARYDEILRLRSQSMSAEVWPEALQSRTITALREQLSRTMSTVSRLEVTLGPRHPELIAGRASVRHIEKQIRAEVDRIAGATRVERDRAVAQQDAIAARLKVLKANVLKTKNTMLGLRELRRQTQSDRDVYEAFLKRAGELSAQKSVDTTSARLISAATPPLEKGWPPRTLILLAGTMLGCAIGVAYALLREQFDPCVRSPRQIWQETGLPVLARIAHSELSMEAIGQGHSFARRECGPGSVDQLYNRIARGAGASARSVFLTTVNADDTAAMASLSLVCSGTESGDRLVLIDADMANAHLSQRLGMEEEPGLAELLHLGDDVKTIHEVSNDPPLWFVPTGGVEISKGERRCSRAVRKMIDQKNGECDLVVINGGPLWSSRLHRDIIDTADMVILIATAFETPMEGLMEATDALAATGARVGGVILVD